MGMKPPHRSRGMQDVLKSIGATPPSGLQDVLGMPQLTSELFGSAWDERLAEAVDRLERADETIADSPEPERAVEELVADAATVQEAAPPEAQERVNI